MTGAHDTQPTIGALDITLEPPSEPSELSEPTGPTEYPELVAPVSDPFIDWSPDNHVYRLAAYACPQCARQYVFGVEDLPAGEGAEDLEQTQVTVSCGACGQVMRLMTGEMTSDSAASDASDASDANDANDVNDVNDVNMQNGSTDENRDV